MKILRKDTDLNILLNTETDFQTNLGWEESLKEFETEILSDIINPIENYETVRYIHKPYLSDGVRQTDIWFYFYFLNTGGTYVQDYYTGDDEKSITYTENEQMLKQSTQSFFRLEFFKTPHKLNTSGNIIGYEPPTRQNRKLIFAKNLSLPLGEKMFYNPLNGYIHLPVFRGSNYSNKENMYFFWFQDESVLTETNLSGTTTGNTFFMTAKFYNAKDGTILDFTNDAFSTSYSATGITESTDMYYQVDINKLDYSYQVYFYNGVVKCEEVGLTNKPIMFFERGGGTAPSNILYHICSNVTPTPTITPTPTRTPALTPTNTPTPTPTPSSTSTVSCVDCSTSTVTSGTTNSGFLLQTHCLNLSSASNGATIFIAYQAYSRLNRFYVSENGLTTVSGTNTGWVGTDNTYPNPPYTSPDSASGTISFIYNSSKTYELNVEIANENPLNPQNDSYEFTLTCGGVVTPTPTPTPTNTFSLSMVFSFQVGAGYGGSCQLYKSIDGITYSFVNSFSTTDSVTFTPDAGWYYYITTNKTSGSGIYAQSVWNIDSIGNVNLSPTQDNGTSIDSTPFQVATSGVHIYELRGYVTNSL